MSISIDSPTIITKENIMLSFLLLLAMKIKKMLRRLNFHLPLTLWYFAIDKKMTDKRLDDFQE